MRKAGNDQRRAYLRDYQRTWMRKRRDEWVAAHGPCVLCGSSQNLEVDHTDPSAKKITPARLWSLATDNPQRIVELAKCQVLCRQCHAEKTSQENSARFGGARAKIAALDDIALTEARARIAQGNRSCDIARDLGVSKHVIGRVKRGEAYKKGG